MRSGDLQAMTPSRPIRLQGLEFSVPPGWNVEDSGSEVTIYRSGSAGAITISTYRNNDATQPANALDQCMRFLASRKHGDVPVRGSPLVATAEFTDESGVRWIVTTTAQGNRFALGTYNSDARDASEESEAREILSGLRLHD